MPYDDMEDHEEVDKVGATFALVIFGLIIAALFLCSCTVGYATDGTKKAFVGAVGGKGATKSGLLAMNWDNEKSLNDVAMLGAIAIPAAQAVVLGKSADKLSASQTASAASVSNHAASEETKRVLGLSKDGVTKATVLPK